MDYIKSGLAAFKNRKIVVIGDVMLDTYIEGEVSRINPEAPVPIVNLKNEFYELGGAANVSANITSLGGKASLFGFIGKDSTAEILKNLLLEKNIKFYLDENSITTEKTRVVADSQQLIRYDKEETSDKIFTEKTKQELLKEIQTASLILISDYAKGTITSDLMDFISQYKKKIIVDPKPKNTELYKNVLLITPNEKESLAMSSCSDVRTAGEFLRKKLGSDILITRGEKGMLIFSETNMEIPTYAREVYDVTGAGDTAVSALALAIAAGASISEAVIIANHAAGIAVEKKGTYHVSLRELKEKIFSEGKKVLEFEDLQREISDAKRKGKRVIWTNGCFDLLHIGHTRYLRKAKELGDVLIVGINSDSSVKTLKGQTRPIQTETERAEIISSLEFVDYVTIFQELTVEKYLKHLRPDIYVKGGDYDADSINQDEKSSILSYGGKIEFLPLIENKSSSGIIEKFSQANNRNA